MRKYAALTAGPAINAIFLIPNFCIKGPPHRHIIVKPMQIAPGKLEAAFYGILIWSFLFMIHRS